MFSDQRKIRVPVPPAQAFQPIRRIGGTQGWYYANFLWEIRGWMDVLVGGPGLRPGRLHPDTLQVGDTLDWWRVEAYEPGHLLRLRAEMKVPGQAWLEFCVQPDDRGGSLITQTATYDPGNFWGKLYWWAMWPFHQVLFPGLLRAIGRQARQLAKEEPQPCSSAEGP